MVDCRSSAGASCLNTRLLRNACLTTSTTFSAPANIPHWGMGPGIRSLLWIPCAREALSSWGKYRRASWGEIWLWAVFCISLLASHLLLFEESILIITEEFAHCYGSSSHPADPRALRVPICLSPAWKDKHYPWTALSKPRQCRNPQTKGNAEFSLLQFVTHRILLTYSWK